MGYKPIYDITKFTALDYPEHLAAIIWFARCNMRCPYCYNTDIVFGEGKISEDEALKFLKSRIGLLEGVVLSGGECTLQEGILDFCQKIKELGFKIKLDTNATQYEKVVSLVENSLIDYIAVDYKAPEYKFHKITKNTNFENFSKTVDYLIKKEFLFEARTTVHSSLLDEDDINWIIKDLQNRGYKGIYYLQNFLYDENTIDKVEKQKKELDRSKIVDLIKIEYRNF